MNRDKRTDRGGRRYVRRVGDQAVLLPECNRFLDATLTGESSKWRCGTEPSSHAGVCSSCHGAVLTADEAVRAALVG